MRKKINLALTQDFPRPIISRMGSEIIICVASQCGQHLNGRVLAEKNLIDFTTKLASVPQGAIVVLDFSDVAYVTGSWVNAALVPLYLWAREDEHDLFFVFSGVRDDWLDELQLVAEWNYQCYLVAQSPKEARAKATLVGKLDTAQGRALQAVLEFGQVTGAELERQRPEEDIRATAWNNRLVDLFDKRLVKRIKQGRAQIYSPVVKEITWHG